MGISGAVDPAHWQRPGVNTKDFVREYSGAKLSRLAELLQLMVLVRNDAFTLGLNIKVVYFLFFISNGSCWDDRSCCCVIIVYNNATSRYLI